MWGLALAALVGCGTGDPAELDGPPPVPPPAPRPRGRPETHAAMVEDLAAVRHPSDGGGTVTRVSGPEQVVAGGVGRWELELEVGALGVAEGGAVVFQAPAFWGWDPPQDQSPELPGHTAITTLAEGVHLDVAVFDQGLVRALVRGRALVGGERVRVTYGGARADRFAESESELWLAVDGDGDGVRALVAEPVRIAVVAGEARRLLVTLPSSARPGERVVGRVAVLDGVGNAGVPWTEPVALAGPEGLRLPAEVRLGPDGVGRFEAELGGEGVFAVVAASGRLEGWSNPMVARDGAAPILWADLQIHTARSDGSGTPDEVWRYARDVAGLDVAAITDHDHWGMRFLDATPALWDESRDLADRYDEPGQFVAIAGYEWTSWLHGHRHVLWFEPDPPLFSSMAPKTGDPPGLWAALAGRRALTVAHHPGGGPVATDWRFAPPPELEPVVEIASVHGQSEWLGLPGAIYDPDPTGFVRDQLRAGRRLGLIGSTDGHDGHPGLAHLAAPSGGLAAILATDRTREAVYDALRARRTYATNGPRIVLRFEVGGTPMGGERGSEPVDAVVRAIGTAPIVRVHEVRRSGERVLVEGSGQRVAHHAWTIEPTGPEDFVYVVVEQEDGGLAWSSPVWFGPGSVGG